LPFCPAEDRKKLLAWLMAVPAISAAGTKADGLVSCKEGESFENSWA
jgi:hypothetical protein